jgi:hypothetical protein
MPVSPSATAKQLKHLAIHAAVLKINQQGGYLSTDLKVVSRLEMIGLFVRSFFRFDNHAALKLQFGKDVVAQKIREELNGGAHLSSAEITRINDFLAQRLRQVNVPVHTDSVATAPEAAVSPSAPSATAPVPQEIVAAPRSRFERVQNPAMFRLDLKNFKNAIKQAHFEGIKPKQISQEVVQTIVADLTRLLAEENKGFFKSVHHEKRSEFIELLFALFTASSKLGRIEERKEFLGQLKTMAATLPNQFGYTPYLKFINEIKGLCIQFELPCAELEPEVFQSPFSVFAAKPTEPVRAQQEAPVVVRAPIVPSSKPVDLEARKRQFVRNVNVQITQLRSDFDKIDGFFFKLDSKEGNEIFKRLNGLTNLIIENKDVYRAMNAQLKKSMQTVVVNVQRALVEKGAKGNHPIFLSLNTALYQ